MSPIFTFIVAVLVLLAVANIVVGVGNDAVNFMNSAWGSRAASYRTILIVAAVGIVVGTITSNGMMEVARSGVFYPGSFTFPEIMMLFLGMMLGNVVLFNIFNTLGLPTSTTVSMVFGLLGAALAVAGYKIAVSPDMGIEHISHFVNSGKAMVIISGILLSVIIAFTTGLILMYISRVIFSFRYNKMIKRFGAMWCAITVTGIIYFALFKGLKSSGLIPDEFNAFVQENTFICLAGLWFVVTIILFILQLLRINIMRATILSGTFALALAFAGNDLVNFIGVPIAGYDSYLIAREAAASGIDCDTLHMSKLAEPAVANFYLLISAGVVMILTLFLSKETRHVAQTELSLSSQNEGEEQRFSSTLISRGLVRMALIMNKWYTHYVPRKVQDALDKRFEPLPPEERNEGSFDLIRSVVNITSAAVLISIATSLKLPLSTTYVVFMVSMGSSLADRAWGRESAVYRITGVMTVISGWFVTAFAALFISALFTVILLVGGWVAVILASGIGIYSVIRSFTGHKVKLKKEKNRREKKLTISQSDTTEDVLYNCIEEVCYTMEEISRIYNRTLVATFKENRKVLRDMVTESNALFEEARVRKYQVINTLKKLEKRHIDTGHFYVQVVDYLSEVTKSLIHITRPAYDHIDNNHTGLNKEQIADLMRVNDGVEEIFTKINEMLRTKDFADLDMVLLMRDQLFDTIVVAIKNQLRRIDENSSTKAGLLYLSILNETKSMVLQARNLLKSQSYFLENKDH
ncbi:MAG: inorganic phosphate transporter [Coprobacter sp.]|nr:inorganic phosphate transporter [Coprobacter sp.]